MKSVATRRFWELFHALPAEVQKLAVKNYHLWRDNPNHPSLHFRRLQASDDQFTVRIGDHHRAIARMAPETAIWVWIGTHARV
jgi:hypothetical protein